jgi:glutathione reductase (NADPH)
VNIFAVGDCTDRIPLTPSAIAQAKAFADTEFGGQPQIVNYEYVPISIASHPQAATVGLSEALARDKFGDAVYCYHTQFRPLFYCLTKSNQQSLLKVVVNTDDSERVLGIHMVGDCQNLPLVRRGKLTTSLGWGCPRKMKAMPHTIQLH